jgi:hypothetical protein
MDLEVVELLCFLYDIFIIFLFLTGFVERRVTYVCQCPKETLTPQVLRICVCVCVCVCVCKVPKTLIDVLEDFDTSKT